MVIVRHCVRALLDAADDGVLLMRIAEPGTENAFWITPGGGKEHGESDEDALRRELTEETGFTPDHIGPVIWTRDFTFDWLGETYRQIEQFHWVPCERFVAEPTSLDGVVESSSFHSLRWWALDEIDASDETFAPLDLAAHIRCLRTEGVGRAPTVLGP